VRRNTTPVVIVLLVLASVAGVAAPVAGSTAVADADRVGTAVPAAHGGGACEYPYSAPDVTGEEVTVDEKPERIVALGASTAQTLWELDADERVVGVSTFATYLDGADEKTVVTETEGFSTTVLVEEIVGLDPDVVLAANVYPNESLDQIREAGIPVYKFPLAGSIEDVYDKTGRIGHLAGACEAADATVERMRGEIDTVREAVAGEDRPRVLYPQSGGFAPGPNTFIGGLIDAAGGANIAANANATSPYPQLSGEFVVEQDPEWLIVSAPPGQADSDPRDLVPEGPALRNTTAWEEGNFVVVGTNNVSQPAPRIVSPLRRMAQAFHPEAYAAAEATPTATEPPGTDETTATDSTGIDATTTGTDDGTPTLTATGTEAPGLPGFGVGVAAVALLALVVLARRG
jgi:iron complex transport system substrate-binding protein